MTQGHHLGHFFGTPFAELNTRTIISYALSDKETDDAVEETLLPFKT